jgi:hypothetical protein
MNVTECWTFVINLRKEVWGASDTPYKSGYIDALNQVVEWLEETAWDIGEDLPYDD